MNKCYSSNDCSDNEKCISDGYEKKCTPNTTQPPKPEPGYLPTIPPKDTSPEQNTDAWKEASEQILVLNKKQKDKVMSGHGFITEFIVVGIEFVVMILKFVYNLYKEIWQFIYLVVSSILLSIFKPGNGITGWGEKYRCKNKKRIKKLEPGSTILVKDNNLKKKAVVLQVNDNDTFKVMYRDGNISTISKNKIQNIEDLDGTCNCHPKGCGAYTVTRLTLLKIVTYMFPPYGVFLKKGISGIGDILITSILTVLLYFPGLLYALSVVDDSESCKTSITIYSEPGKKGKHEVLQYGDYNMYDEKLNKFNPCNKKYFIDYSGLRTKNDITGAFILNIKKLSENTGAAFIHSLKIGSGVNAILYKNNNFTGEIATIEGNVDDLSYLKSKAKESCAGSKLDFVSIKSISIVPKNPKKLRKIGDHEIIVYEFVNFRGDHKSFKLDDIEVLLKSNDISSYFDAPSLGHFSNNISSIRIGPKVKATLIPSSFGDFNLGPSGYHTNQYFSFGKGAKKKLDDWLNRKAASGAKLNVNEDEPNLFNTKEGNFGLKTMSILIKKK